MGVEKMEVKHPRWQDIPPAWRTSAYQWWSNQYHRHIDAGFSDADARLMILHLARHQPGPHRLMIAQHQAQM